MNTTEKGNLFESYIQHIYSILLNMDGENIVVCPKAKIKGAWGVHEFDLYYQFEKAGITHRVAIECKNIERPVEKGHIQEFDAKLKCLKNVIGVFISDSGFQEGAITYARYSYDHYQRITFLNVLDRSEDEECIPS